MDGILEFLTMMPMLIHVKVKPNSEKEEIVELSDGEYLVYLKEAAEDGKANRRLINILAKKFGVHFSKVKIKNPKSRDKVVEVCR